MIRHAINGTSEPAARNTTYISAHLERSGEGANRAINAVGQRVRHRVRADDFIFFYGLLTEVSETSEWQTKLQCKRRLVVAHGPMVSLWMLSSARLDPAEVAPELLVDCSWHRADRSTGARGGSGVED